MGAFGFKIWIFAPKSCLFGGIRVRNQLISAVCLQFALKSLFFNDFFAIIPLFKPLNVSCLFTFSSADCLLYCQLIVYFLSAVCLGELGFKISWFQLSYLHFCAKILVCFFHQYFVKIMLQSFVCLHFQLFVYFFVSWVFTFVSCLFTLWIFAPKSLVFHQSFVKIMLQSLFTFSAICFHF